MSYRCQPCGHPVAAGRPLLVHVVVRTAGPLKGTILREVPVCGHCKQLLDMGVPLRDIHRKEYHRPVKVKPKPVPLTRGSVARVKGSPVRPLVGLVGLQQPPKARPKSWKRVAVWGDAKTHVEAGVIGSFHSVEKAEEACKRFRKQFDQDPGVDAWVRPQD